MAGAFCITMEHPVCIHGMVDLNSKLACTCMLRPNQDMTPSKSHEAGDADAGDAHGYHEENTSCGCSKDEHHIDDFAFG